ncbi:glycine betaine ABC transporter substrate-binding protein [Haloarculaceae archaeon H-GB2-1]|nr:glycine betaine ABC transporter substrate-binding protein [Haloarculaceae archaeon H-GB1-1]MEA5386091.1 glycine betaine ABC transporter substrate-binding protein [Haloarculaceae archaeon H-GB11]MEA5407597.1 glycine betaine ABC transporter substrate-binding protein [Haloarculaceae archaeon H-GB2-1]
MDGTYSRRDVLRGGGLVGAGLLAGCLGSGSETDSSSGSSSSGDQFVVGSKTFAENKILGYMAYEIIKNNTSVEVVDEMSFGATSKAWDGLVNGPLDMYWSYTGTLWLTHPPTNDSPIPDKQEQYEKAKAEMESEYEMEILEMAPFHNGYGLNARPAWIRDTGISAISDLAAAINAGQTDIRIAIGPAFYNRPDGWSGLLEYYGVEESAIAEWNDNGNVMVVNKGLTYAELGAGNTDIAMGFTTDPQIHSMDLQPLEDDESFWPWYNPVPCVSGTDTLEANPDVKTQLNKLGPAIGDASKMRELNGRVVLDGKSSQTVARDFLTEEGLI